MSVEFEAFDETAVDTMIANVAQILRALHGLNAPAVAVAHAYRQTVCQNWWLQVAAEFRQD